MQLTPACEAGAGAISGHVGLRPPSRQATTSAVRNVFAEGGLRLIAQGVPMSRRIVHEGDVLYRQGDRLELVFVVHVGVIKLVNRSSDGHERIAGFRFRGDWVGIDAMAMAHHECDAVALETGEVWTCPYALWLDACVRTPQVLELLLKSISRDFSQAREQMMTLCSLSTAARVAQFLFGWMQAMHLRGLKCDEFTLPLSREDMGHHLGMTLESVSRALNLLARSHLIEFVGKRRRAFRIPDAIALRDFIHASRDRHDEREEAIR
jgi:CRP/FNR family transcriptional regulator